MADFLDEVRFLPEKTRQIYAYLPVVFFASIANALILSYVLWDIVPRLPLSRWLSAILVLTFLRYLSFLAYNKSETKSVNPRPWFHGYLAGLFLSGLIWGLAGILLFPEHSASYQIFLAFVLGGMVAGAIASTSLLRFGFYLFSIPTLLPITVKFLVIPNEIHVAMGIMMVIFLICCILISETFHTSAMDLLLVRFQNEKEIEKRRESESELKQYKEELENLVGERTLQ